MKLSNKKVLKKIIFSTLVFTILSNGVLVSKAQDMELYFKPNQNKEKIIRYGNDEFKISKSEGTMYREYNLKTSLAQNNLYSSIYDPRVMGYMTPVKNQDSLGICWAFSGMSLLETYLKKNDLGEYDFSEEHLRWWANGGSNAWDISDNQGALNSTSISYFTSWAGPKLEKDIPYNGKVSQTQGASKPSNYDTAPPLKYKVTGVMNVANDRVSVKNAIVKYGGVTTGYNHNGLFISKDNTSVYCPADIGQNHAIVIVGWDDNYSSDKFDGFVGKPDKNGAWLVKSSWGNNNSEGGYYWISYEDENILTARDNFSIIKVKDSQGQKMYQYDYSVNEIISTSDNLVAANKFNFTSNELLQSVMFNTDSQGAGYKIFFVPEEYGVLKYGKRIELSRGITDYSGYITVDTGNFPLPNGNGAIAVSITNHGKKVSFGVENNDVSDGSYKGQASYGESYLLSNNDFIDIKGINSLDNVNMSIKAITKSVNGAKLLAGRDRFDTAIEVAKSGFKSADNVILVNSSAIPDALTATPLAKLRNAPILLTGSTELNPKTLQAIKDLKAKNIIIIGGDNSVSLDIEKKLKENYNVSRISGANRIKTSENIANEIKKIHGEISEVAVVNGYTGLSDAISFSPVSGEKTIPILLTNGVGKFDIPNTININKLSKSYIIGGIASVPTSVDRVLINVDRIGGKNRNDTNAKVIEKFYTSSQLENAFVAKDGMPVQDTLIDGLAVGVYASNTKSPLIISHGMLSQEQKRVLSTKKFNNVVQVGKGNNSQAVTEILLMNSR